MEPKIKKVVDGLFPEKPNGSVRAEEITLTPELAQVFLSLSKNVRNLSKAPVESYARMMREGAWERNGESIKFQFFPGGEGWRLVDGQHRCAACVKAGVPVRLVIAVGVAGSQNVDVQRKRAASQLATSAGTKNARTACAIAGILWREARGMKGVLRTAGNSAAIASSEIVKMLEDDPLIERSAVIVACCKKLVTTSILGYVHYKASKQDSEAADLFILELESGAGLKETDPVFKLRERMIRENMRVGGNRKPPPDLQYELCWRAWEAYREGREMKVLRLAAKKPDAI